MYQAEEKPLLVVEKLRLCSIFLQVRDPENKVIYK